MPARQDPSDLGSLIGSIMQGFDNAQNGLGQLRDRAGLQQLQSLQSELARAIPHIEAYERACDKYIQGSKRLIRPTGCKGSAIGAALYVTLAAKIVDNTGVTYKPTTHTLPEMGTDQTSIATWALGQAGAVRVDIKHLHDELSTRIAAIQQNPTQYVGAVRSQIPSLTNGNGTSSDVSSTYHGLVDRVTGLRKTAEEKFKTAYGTSAMVPSSALDNDNSDAATIRGTDRGGDDASVFSEVTTCVGSSAHAGDW
jgi:hypothetical protein